MPVIPVYQRKVGLQAMPTVRVQAAGPEAFGAGIGAGLMQLGEAEQIRQDKIDTAAVITAENTIQEQTTNFMYKDLLQRRGAAAATAEKDFEDYWKSTVPEVRKGLSPKAQQAFDNRIGDYKAKLLAKVYDHANTQNDVALQDALNGAAYSAALSFSQPGAYLDAESADKMRMDLHQKTAAAMFGRDPAAISAHASKLFNGVMAASLKTLHDQNDVDGVAKWLELYKDKVDPTVTAPYVGWVQDKSEILEINARAESIIESNLTDDGDVDIGKALTLARQEKDPAKQDKLASRIKVRASEIEAAIRQNEGKKYNDAMLKMMQVNTVDEMEAIVDGAELQKAEHRVSLRNMGKSRLKIDESGLPSATPMNVWIRALTDYETGKLGNLSEFMMKYGKDMSSADIRRFSERIMKGDTDISWMQMIKKIAPKVRDEDIADVFDTVGAMENEFKSKNGRAPTNVEREQIVTHATAKIVVGRKWWGPSATEPRYNVSMPEGTYWDENLKRFVVEKDGKLMEVKPKKREG